VTPYSEAVYNSADELADAVRSHRAGDGHLEQNRWDRRERCRIVDHLSLVTFSLAWDTYVAAIYLSFTFVTGLPCGFACPMRKRG
jgi:hypothetical protein